MGTSAPGSYAGTAASGASTSTTLRDTSGKPWSLSITTDGNVLTAPTASPNTQVKSITDADTMADRMPDSPRMRRTLSSLSNGTTTTTTGPYVLGAGWNTLGFKLSGTYDQDSFPDGRYDETAKKVIAGGSTATTNYRLEFHYGLSATLLPVQMQLRFAIPAPTPVYFPFPDETEPYVDLQQSSATPWRGMLGLQVYMNSIIRTYGFQLQIRYTGTLTALQRPSITAGALLLYQGS